MARGDPKFASQQGDQWLPHDFGKVYAQEKTSTQPRLGVAASFDGTALLRELTLALAEPFLLLYVLVVPRGRSEPGRYQSGELSRTELDAVFQQFAQFWDSDGRHNIWIRSSDDGMLVYDRHNLIYAYGPLERFESVLRERGYTIAPGLSLDFPHQHSYHQEFDDLERELSTRFAVNRSELREGDENP
ncbi:MAG: hypothetical protein ACJ8NS_04815 [Chthoniobacterales bacterium]